MGKRITIKDIAAEAGVSTGTVHRAIYGKKGVSEEIKQKILALCAERGYQANMAASVLKRNPLRIVGAFPIPDDKGRYFYAQVWKGFRRCMDEFQDYDLEAIELPYCNSAAHTQGAELRACFERYEGKIDALVTIGHFDEDGKQAVKLYHESGIPIFLACDDAKQCGRLVCVQADHQMTGRLAAELLANQTTGAGAILLCAGDLLIPSHSETVRGFETYLLENRKDLELIKLYGYQNEQDLCTRLREELVKRPDLLGAFSVSARLSVLLINELTAHAATEQVCIVVSDLFEETFHNLETGIIRNILYKDPEQQVYLAAKYMCDFLLRAQKPARDIHYIESRVIFKSNMDMYR